MPFLGSKPGGGGERRERLIPRRQLGADGLDLGRGERSHRPGRWLRVSPGLLGRANIYARSVAGVTPRASVTYFQAQRALANSGKRLLTNAEWQSAVAGSPDGASCNVSSGSVQSTGANAACISTDGANDMVGNLWEWVGDWLPVSTGCPSWGAFSNDDMCLSGASATATAPGALLRGGAFGSGLGAGPFAVSGDAQPSASNADVGFRGAR